MDELIGKPVRLTIGNMGAMTKDGSARYFTDRHFGPDDLGLTVAAKMPEHFGWGWYALDVSDDPNLYIPAHVDMFEVVA